MKKKISKFLSFKEKTVFWMVLPSQDKKLFKPKEDKRLFKNQEMSISDRISSDHQLLRNIWQLNSMNLNPFSKPMKKSLINQLKTSILINYNKNWLFQLKTRDSLVPLPLLPMTSLLVIINIFLFIVRDVFLVVVVLPNQLKNKLTSKINKN